MTSLEATIPDARLEAPTDALRAVGGVAIREILRGREEEVLTRVRTAYLVHAAGDTSLPHSTFLRFPGDDVSRIIALPAYLGGESRVAGVKWIASFPTNLDLGIERASALIVLNSTTTGRPTWILEGSTISALRTAAGAALAARAYFSDTVPDPIGIVGTGVISFEIVRLLRAAFGRIPSLLLHDLREDRAIAFRRDVEAEWGGGVDGVAVATDLHELLARCRLVSFATTAVVPHVGDLSSMPPGGLVLHISLRDLTPPVILACDNVVDDPDHVCRAATSVHLAEEESGSRSFIRCTLADLLRGAEPSKPDPDAPTIFSPFGLGILDLALAELVAELASESGADQSIQGFFP